jgi:hypothetical protein
MAAQQFQAVGIMAKTTVIYKVVLKFICGS